MPSRLIALMVTLLLSLHMGTPSYAADKASAPIETAMAFSMEDRAPSDLPEPADDGSQPYSTHGSPSCHDHCKGVVAWAGGNVVLVGRLPIEARAATAPLGFVSILVPPPQQRGSRGGIGHA